MAHQQDAATVEPVATCSDAELDIEFAYTNWQQACHDLYTLVQSCKRPKGHADEHASGYGSQRTRWHR
ncbi:MAG: hypothetical protein H0V49_05285 [Nocardioidaceae bacterium]|nr:hypothetical protein [Nocardioidaceae bacterium]